MLDEFIGEVEQVRGDADHSLKNIGTYITSKFTRFISDRVLRNITCQTRVLDLERVVNGGKVLLFYLGKGRFGDHAAGLLASQIVSRIRHVVMKRGARPDAPPFYLYADEFQLFADERFAGLLAEARKFKLALTVAHQYVQQIPETVLRAILGNVGEPSPSVSGRWTAACCRACTARSSAAATSAGPQDNLTALTTVLRVLRNEGTVTSLRPAC